MKPWKYGDVGKGGSPKILLLVASENFSFVINEISDIVQLSLPCLFTLIGLYYCTWYDANPMPFCQFPILV